MPVILELLGVRFLVAVAALAYLILNRSASTLARGIFGHLPGFLRNGLRVAFAPAVTVGHWLGVAAHRVTADVSHAAAASLSALTHLFHGFAVAAQLVGETIEQGAVAVDHAFARLIHHTIPALILRAVAPVRHLAHLALHTAEHAIGLIHVAERDFTRGIDRLHKETGVLARLFHGIDAFVHHRVWPAVRSAEHAIAVTIPRDLARVRAEERALAARIGRIEKLIGLGVLGALLVRVLARIAPWLFCRNWKRVGPKVCGLNPSLLNWLLGVGAAMFAFSELCRLVELVGTVAARVLPVLVAPLAVASSALCGGNHSAAPPLTIQTTALPTPANPLPL